MRLSPLVFMLTGAVLAGGVQSVPSRHVSNAQARTAYREVTSLLRQGKLGEARKQAALAVQATAANLPPCVKPGSAQGSTFSVLFRPGEALRVMTSVGGGRVNLYELRPDGIYRVWQAQKSASVNSGTALTRMLGVLPGAAQCGTPPQLNGPLEMFSFNPFTGGMFAYELRLTGELRTVKFVNLDRALGGGRTGYSGLPDAPPLELR